MKKPSIRSTLDAFSLAIDPAATKVVFQPIVDLRRKKLFAVEALARCQIPGLTSPQQLFEDAVDNGYVGRLGRLIRELTVEGCPSALLAATTMRIKAITTGR